MRTRRNVLQRRAKLQYVATCRTSGTIRNSIIHAASHIARAATHMAHAATHMAHVATHIAHAATPIARAATPIARVAMQVREPNRAWHRSSDGARVLPPLDDCAAARPATGAAHQSGEYPESRLVCTRTARCRLVCGVVIHRRPGRAGVWARVACCGCARARAATTGGTPGCAMRAERCERDGASHSIGPQSSGSVYDGAIGAGSAAEVAVALADVSASQRSHSRSHMSARCPQGCRYTDDSPSNSPHSRSGPHGRHAFGSSSAVSVAVC